MSRVMEGVHGVTRLGTHLGQRLGDSEGMPHINTPPPKDRHLGALNML